jgi:diaminohydroxyphosphoribosylaminopyrimidine deaminase/5-amino-6-(5-phosphoribosylamino)uracil reductase
VWFFSVENEGLMSDSLEYMQRALHLARQALGRTAPNPAVGAVIVRDGRIVGEGFHPRAGEPHAEIFALRQAGELARGADIYVTLEPCAHQGRTGPCVEALIAAGISSVFAAVVDPNPLVAGRGIERLKTAGIRVEVGLCADEARKLIAPFAWHLRHQTPYTLYKAAMTFDGQVATACGDSRWVSSEHSRLRVHQLRDQVDAILVGIETVLADDPQLTTRLPAGGRDPLRVVVDSQLRIPLNSRIVNLDSRAKSLIATTDQADADKVSALQAAGCEVLILPAAAGRVDLPELWRQLGARGVQFLLLEGGRTLAAEVLRHRLLNAIQLYLAPKLVAGQGRGGLFAGCGCELMSQALDLGPIDVERVGADLLLTAEVKSCLPD